MATASAIVGVVGAIGQAVQARRAERAQERSRKIENVRASVARQRSIQQRLAQARILRAQTEAAGFATGAPGATAVSGAVGGIQSDVASNIAFSQGQFSLQQAAAAQQSAAAGFANQAQLIGGVTSAVAGGFQTFNPNTTAGQQNIAGARRFFGF